MISRHFIVKGIVQGVSFRRSTEIFVNSNSLNLVGFVRNLNNGSVEVHVKGPVLDVCKLQGFLKNGPKYSRVDSLEYQDVDLNKDLKSFVILKN